MTILPRLDAVEAGGAIIKSTYWIFPLLILYGLFAAPLGMTMDRYMVSMILFVVATACLAITGYFIVEHERLLGFPFGDGPEDDLRYCIPQMILQTGAFLVAVVGIFLGMLVALGFTDI